MITFRYALCIALATALSPLTASQDSRSYLPSRSANNQQPTSASYSSASSSHTNNRLTPFRTSLDDEDNDSGNESDNNKKTHLFSSSTIQHNSQYPSQIPAGHAANRDTCNHNNGSSHDDSQEPDTQYFGMQEDDRSYSTLFSSDKNACEPMSAKEKEMKELLETQLVRHHSEAFFTTKQTYNLSIQEFEALANKIAPQIVQERVAAIRKENKEREDDHAIVATGIEALSKHQDHQNNVDTSAGQDFYNKTGKIKQVIIRTQADIQLNVARELLPISFHWNILPTSHKCGIGAAVLFAGVGIYNTIKHFFGSKAPQYNPELVDAAVNQEAHA